MNIKLDDSFFQKLLSEASLSPRKRSHFNLHKELDESVQRLCIALKKGTYVRPHYHPKNNKWELILALRGAVVLLIFDSAGVIIDRLKLRQGESLTGIELEPGTWHTLFPLDDEAVILEIKEGPYTPTELSDFASWAPAEGEINVSEFLKWMENSDVGSSYKNSK